MSLYYGLIISMVVIAFTIYAKHINFTNKKIENILYLAIIFGLLMFFSSFRGENIGNDTKEYLSLFNSLQDVDIKYWLERYEIGYLLLNKFLSIISDNQQIIIIVTSIIILLGYSKYIYKYSNIVWLSTFLFFTLGYFGGSMNTIRQQIAIVIILKSYSYLREEKLIKFIVFVVLASLFHSISIIFIIAYPISKLEVNSKVILNGFIVTVLGYLGFDKIFRIIVHYTKYKYYLDSIYTNGQIRIASIINAFIIIITLIFTFYVLCMDVKNRYIFNKDKDIKLMTLLLLVSASINIISFKFNLLDRVAQYFSVFMIVYIPNVISKVKDKKKVMIYIWIVIVLFLAYFSLVQIFKPEWNRIYPYKFYWI